MVKNMHKPKTCPECGSDNISYKETTNQLICKDCGLIYEPLAEKAKK